MLLWIFCNETYWFFICSKYSLFLFLIMTRLTTPSIFMYYDVHTHSKQTTVSEEVMTVYNIAVGKDSSLNIHSGQLVSCGIQRKSQNNEYQYAENIQTSFHRCYFLVRDICFFFPGIMDGRTTHRPDNSCQYQNCYKNSN